MLWPQSEPSIRTTAHTLSCAAAIGMTAPCFEAANPVAGNQSAKSSANIALQRALAGNP